MALTRDDRIQSTPRASKDPKSYEYARQMVYVLKTCWKRVTFDLQDWEKEVQEARQNKIWEQLGYDSIDEVLAKEVGYSEAELKIKCKQARDNPLAGHGTNQHSDLKDKDARENPLCEHGGVGNTKSSKYGTTVDYTLRRLARDNPELLDAIERGELSVNAAAIQAGIRKKPSQAEVCIKAFRKAENRMEVLKLITQSLEPYERIWIMDWLNEST